MADSSIIPLIQKDTGGNREVRASGSTTTFDSGATETHANNPAFSGNPTFTGTPDFSGAAGVTQKAGSVTAAALTSNLKLGYIPLPLTGARVVAANDVPAKGADDGGVISKDTDPILERVNGATDKRLRLKWAAASVVEVILGSFAYPPDLDDTAAVVVKTLAKMAGATDTPVLAISYFEGSGDVNAGGNTAACSAAEAVKSVTIAAGDVGAAPKSATVGITPGAHGTDALDIYACWVEYTRRS